MILLTGGTGLIGSHLLFDLLIKGNTVRVLKRKTADTGKTLKTFSYYSDHPEHLLNRVEWCDGDLLDIFSLEDAIDGIDYVYHCGGFVSFDPGDKEQVYKVNIEGTANLINIALDKKIKKFCHVSSIAALGRTAPEEYIDEETHWKTSKRNSHYAISKYGAEREVWRGVEEGLNSVIVSPSVVIGPGDWDDGSSRFIKTVWKGLKVYTMGVNGFVDVRDVSKAMIELMESDILNERFILSAESLTYQDLTFKIADALEVKKPKFKATKFMSELAWRIDKMRSFVSGTPPFITKETARTAVDKYYYSNGKIIKALGFEFRNIDETIKDTCRCFLNDME